MFIANSFLKINLSNRKHVTELSVIVAYS